METEKLERRVFVHSFHSQVFETLAELNYEPDVVVAHDSHFDVSLPLKDTLILMPSEIRLAATRVSAHTLIRQVLGGLPGILRTEGLSTDLLPDMFLVVPKCSLKTHIFAAREQLLHGAMISGVVPAREFTRSRDGFLNYLSLILGIKVFTSPPRNLLKLAKILGESESILLDLDVDYFYELQAECYTPLKNAQASELGQMGRVQRFIRKVKPSLITISEAKVAAIRNPKGNFSKFVNKLRAMGYEVEYTNVFASDEEAEESLTSYQRFHEQIWKPITEKQLIQGELRSDIERHISELREATKKYFHACMHLL